MSIFSTFRRLTLVALIAVPYGLIALETAPRDLALRFEEPVAPRAPGTGLKVMVTDGWAMPGAAPEARS